MARKVYYNGQSLEVSDELTVFQIKEAYSQIFPEIRNCEVVIDPDTGDITFEPKVGKKG